MELLLCINASRFAYPHNLVKGRVYTLLDTYKCPCGNAFVKVDGASILGEPLPRRKRLFCKNCYRWTLPLTIWGYFWYKRFIPINDPKLTLTEEEKESMNA